MISTSSHCVVDASVAIKLFVAQPESERADALFAHLAADPPARLSVPELFYVECANILWKYARFSGLPAVEALRSLDQLLALNLERVSLAEIAPAALAIALAQEVTAYDACYVATAHHLHLPLITADQRLVGKMGETPYDVRLLRDFPAAHPG